MIQWYPGHMAKAIREIGEKIKLVDVVIVLLDARIPKSSFNPEIKKILNNKRCLYLLTKADKADDEKTKAWVNYYNSNKTKALAINSFSSKDIKQVLKSLEELMALKRESDMRKGLKPRAIRTMIVGIPNVGKSTLINALVGKKVATVGNKPGVTKSQQWIKINQAVELLDTPGVLWPKFENEEIGFNLAITNAIKDDILPLYDVAIHLIDFLNESYPKALELRYKRSFSIDPTKLLEEIAIMENFYLSNKELDLDSASKFVLQEFRSNMYGKITLEMCNYENN